MIYHCDRCGAALGPGGTACAACGRRFDTPVPADAETPTAATSVDVATPDGLEALLRGRRANGPSALPGTAPGPAPGALPGAAAPPVPAWYGAPPPARGAGPTGGSGRLWLGLGSGLIVVLALVVWGSWTLWMRGPGGDREYRLHNLRGNAARQRGDFQTADDEYSQMIALRPRRVDGYLLRAINEYQEGEIAQSIRDDTTALTLARGPMTRGDLLYNRGEGYTARGKLPQAIADYTQALGEYRRARDPRYLGMVPERLEDAYRQRADAYRQQGDDARALADESTVLAHARPRPADYIVRAQAETGLGQTSAALADFGQALRLDPSDMAAYDGLAALADKARLYPQAVAAYADGVRAEPRSAHLWGNLGWFQYEAGQLPQAIESDRRALSLDPAQVSVLYNLGLCFAAAGFPARAQPAYAAALARGSQADRQSALTDLGHALARQPGSAALQEARRQVLAGRVGGSAPLPVPAAPPLSAPPADPAFAAHLGPEVTVGAYAFRPPAGYVLTQHPVVTLDGQGTVFLWRAPARPDGTAPDIQVLVSEDDGKFAAQSDSVQAAQSLLASFGDNHSPLRQSPVTLVPVGGLTFARGAWSGVGQRTGRTYEGIVYVRVAPSQYIEIQAHDAAPDSRATLPLLRASALTFRRR